MPDLGGPRVLEEGSWPTGDRLPQLVLEPNETSWASPALASVVSCVSLCSWMETPPCTSTLCLQVPVVTQNGEASHPEP
ncbi:unnamed protein product, partial [Gulo gulo]